MRHEIGYIQFSGNCGWAKREVGRVRNFVVLPYLSITLPWGIGRMLFYCEFRIWFWSGQFWVTFISKVEKRQWIDGKYAV